MRIKRWTNTSLNVKHYEELEFVNSKLVKRSVCPTQTPATPCTSVRFVHVDKVSILPLPRPLRRSHVSFVFFFSVSPRDHFVIQASRLHLVLLINRTGPTFRAFFQTTATTADFTLIGAWPSAPHPPPRTAENYLVLRHRSLRSSWIFFFRFRCITFSTVTPSILFHIRRVLSIRRNYKIYKIRRCAN